MRTQQAQRPLRAKAAFMCVAKIQFLFAFAARVVACMSIEASLCASDPIAFICGTAAYAAGVLHTS